MAPAAVTRVVSTLVILPSAVATRAVRVETFAASEVIVPPCDVTVEDRDVSAVASAATVVVSVPRSAVRRVICDDCDVIVFPCDVTVAESAVSAEALALPGSATFEIRDRL